MGTDDFTGSDLRELVRVASLQVTTHHMHHPASYTDADGYDNDCDIHDNNDAEIFFCADIDDNGK